MDAQISVRPDLVIGTVLDLSPRGAFFRPEAALLDDMFTQLAHPPERPAVADVVQLEVVEGEQLRRLTGTVRWIGFHEAHKCRGLGIELEPRLD